MRVHQLSLDSFSRHPNGIKVFFNLIEMGTTGERIFIGIVRNSFFVLTCLQCQFLIHWEENALNINNLILM